MQKRSVKYHSFLSYAVKAKKKKAIRKKAKVMKKKIRIMKKKKARTMKKKFKRTSSILKKEVEVPQIPQQILEPQQVIPNQTEILAKSGLQAEEIEKIRSKINDIADKRTLDREQAFRTFLEDLDSWDAINGFKGVLEKFKSDEDAKTQRITELDNKLKELEQQCSAKDKLLGALASLVDKGIDEQQILQVKTMLESSGMNIQNLNEQVKQYENLIQRIESLKSEEQNIERHISQLKTELSGLNENKTQLQTTVSSLNSEILSKMEEAKSKAEEVKSKAEADLTAAKERIGKLLEELLKQVEKASQETLTIASNSAETVRQEIENARTMAKQPVFGLDDLHDQAVAVCKAFLGRAFDNAPIDMKQTYIMHYENLLALLKKLKWGSS